MCSIFGAFGKNIDLNILNRLRQNAADRGRDGGRMEMYVLDGGYQCYLGNWRATPTTELQHAPLQPYDGLVHNGTISNDRELGGNELEVDSQVLARFLDRTSLSTMTSSLDRVVGSYALACHNGKELFLACNYKPLYYYQSDNGTVYFSSMERHFYNILNSRFLNAPRQFPPYSVGIFRSDQLTGVGYEIWPLPRKFEKRALVIASSGLDSTTVAWKLKTDGYEVHLLHFQYGCLAQTRELNAISRIAEALGATFSVIPIPYTQMAGKAPIMQNDSENIVKDIQGAEYAHEWVPARNLVMLSLASAFAEANGYHVIALGNNLEECMLNAEENRVRMFDENAKLPADLKVGDELLSWNEENKKLEKTVVTKVFEKRVSSYYELTFEGRKFKNRKKAETVKLYLTGEHPIYIKKKGYVRVKDMVLGDVAMRRWELFRTAWNLDPLKNPSPFTHGRRSGKRNPMYGHKRSDTEECWCGEIHRFNKEQIIKTSGVVNRSKVHRQKVSKGVRRHNSSLFFDREKRSRNCKNGIVEAMKRYKERTGFRHWNQTPERREAIRRQNYRLIEEGRINPANNTKRPTEIEKRFISLIDSENLPLRYVGDGQIWITSGGKHLNPDFVNLDLKFALEVTTSNYPFHSPEEFIERKQLLGKVGWRMIYADERDLNDPAVFANYVRQELGGLVNGLKLTEIKRIETSAKVYNIHCEPNNNYFVGKSNILTHNSGAYPDNEEQFTELFDKTLDYAVQNGYELRVTSPVGHLMKHEIVKLGLELGVPYELTWSCYRNGDRHCSICGPCYMRRASFLRNGVDDPASHELSSDEFLERHPHLLK